MNHLKEFIRKEPTVLRKYPRDVTKQAKPSGK